MTVELSPKKDGRNGAERHLIFSLGAEEYAVPLLKVKEVIEVRDISVVPHTPKYYLGIMNLRGMIVSIIDLHFKIKGVPGTIDKRSAVIILDFGYFCFGIAVSSVNRVIPIQDTEIKERPAMESVESLDYIHGVIYREKRLILILAVAKALNREEINATHNAQKQIKIA